MNPVQLRPYQDECLDGIRDLFRTRQNRVILCAPTGAGKTVMFSALTQQTLEKSLTAKVLILTNRIELLTQAGGTLRAFGIRYERITADNRKINHRARCFVGMVETYWNRLDKMPWLLDMTLVIVDECHVGSFKKLFARLKPTTFVIGCTATPLAASKNDPLSNYYQGLVNRVQIKDLVSQGFLSPCVTYSAKIDRSKLKTNKTGEYSDQSQMDTFATRMVYSGLLQRYQEVCDKYNTGLPLKTIVFNVNVAHSLEVTEMFKEAGIPCRHVDGMTPQMERESIIAGYKSGAFPVICNVGILNAGFDDPATGCVVINRATTSVPLWLQSCGRGSRIAPGKHQFIILDMGDNWTELGLWESERDWETLWNQQRRKSDKEGVVPAKSCDSCGALMPISVMVCPHCGYELPVKKKEFAEAEEFVVVTADMLPTAKYSPDEIAELVSLDRASKWKELPVSLLEQIREYRGRKPGWPIHVIREASETEFIFRQKLTELARLRGYKPSWGVPSGVQTRAFLRGIITIFNDILLVIIMGKLQPTLFEDARMDMGGSIDLTIQSLRAYAHHDHWVITWSGGKDSTALVTLIVALILSGEIKRPESLTILFADTRMELPPLAASFAVIAARLQGLDFPVKVVMAPLERRFLPYILGRGVPPPNNTTLRWCTRQIKLEPMGQAIQALSERFGQTVLVLTGVRQGESAVRDARIKMSCGRNGAECGQGWFQQDLTHGVADKLAPILHWRVCLVWDWLMHYARTDAYGGFDTRMLGEAYGQYEDGSANEINARTGCVCCPLASKDTALIEVIKNPEWGYIAPLLGLRTIYREMRKPQHRLRKATGETRKDGTLSGNQNRMGPLTIEARQRFMSQILAIQQTVNLNRPAHHPAFEVLNADEVAFIEACHRAGLYPNKWNGDEPMATTPFLETYADGSQQLDLFL